MVGICETFLKIMIGAIPSCITAGAFSNCITALFGEAPLGMCCPCGAGFWKNIADICISCCAK
jgi:hypothetical protein